MSMANRVDCTTCWSDNGCKCSPEVREEMEEEQRRRDYWQQQEEEVKREERQMDW